MTNASEAVCYVFCFPDIRLHDGLDAVFTVWPSRAKTLLFLVQRIDKLFQFLLNVSYSNWERNNEQG